MRCDVFWKITPISTIIMKIAHGDENKMEAAVDLKCVGAKNRNRKNNAITHKLDLFFCFSVGR